MKKISLVLTAIALLAFGPMAWAQTPANNLPKEVNANDATITHVGHATLTVEHKIVTDSLTRRTDTLRSVTNIEWDTPAGTAKRRNAELNRDNPNGSGFYNEGHSSWLDIYYYNYNYPSIDAEGKPVLLSAMASMPDEDCDYVNNVIIGCHVTITSNKQCPSSYKDEGSKASDVGLLVNHASSGMVFHSAQSDLAYYNLVILPDYEGYGLTRSHAHPYLYQELTARQVVDATRYGIALYKNSPTISSIRHNFRSGWRTISVGYSQGGSVALATHRFIEQNGLTDELNFAGSVCGDGPYDPIATLMYYVKQYNDRYVMSMPVVLPLILKGMCDSNPYMKNHQVSDYLSSDFLATGILGWLTEKEKTTDDITEAWLRYYLSHDDDQHVGPDGKDLYLDLGYILRQAGLGYFQNLYTANASTYTSLNGVPLPTQRGLMQDLHFALSSNNLTKGWVPKHAVFLYHSYDDSVVPEVNRESAGNSFGEWAIKLHASGAGQFDHETTGIQFLLGIAEFEAIRHLAKAPVHQTMQHAIDMKNTISTGWHTIDPWDNPPVIHSNIVLAPLMLNGVEIQAEYKLEEGFAVLGSGYNACIPQYSEGSVEIPATITVDGTTYNVDQISNVAFRMCNKITEVVVPVNVTRIGNFAFQGCQELTTVELPSTLTQIGSGAFIDLPKLTRIDVHAQTPPYWEYNDVFKFHAGGIGDQANYTYDDVLLCVPEGKVQTYKNSLHTNEDIGWTKPDGWGNFLNITETATEGAEAYAAYRNNTLTFHFDTHRADRQNSGYQTYGIAPNDYSLGHLPGWLTPGSSHATDITEVVFTNLFLYARPTITRSWFNGCINLDTIIGIDNLRTDAVTDMSYMFHNCPRLEDDDFDFSGFNTSLVTKMDHMFEDCTSITQLDLSAFDTRSCTSMENMFYGCTGLTSIDLSTFETTACNFSSMFYNCSNLETASLGSFGVEQDNYICTEMFRNCDKLRTLAIPSAFNRLRNAFRDCDHLTEVHCYKPAPFSYWDGCSSDFVPVPEKYTKFHVLASAYDEWIRLYGPDSETPANVTFVGDLGTDTNPILIYGTIDWLNIGTMTDNDVNVNAKMMNDIRVRTMLGSSNHPFKGTFDGNGHTLTVNYEITENVSHDLHSYMPAPFGAIQNAEIKNLKVDGNITVATSTERLGAAGLVGFCPTSNVITRNLITNCHVSTHINGKIEHFGGIVCVVDNNVNTTISGCLFDGYLAADHDYYLQQTIDAGAIVCTVGGTANISHCVENGSYKNISQGHNVFCPTTITPTNSYYFTDGLQGHAKRAYSLTTDTEGLLLDFGTATATYDVSGITAYNTGLKINDVFHVGANQSVNMEITAPGYENVGTPSITGGASLTTIDHVNYTATLVNANAVISMPGIVFTTIVLHDDATDNTLTLEKYVDQTYKVQLLGHTLTRNQWNPLCLPFDLTKQQVASSPLADANLKVLDSITFENKVAVYHFNDTTAITADKPYLVQIRSGQDIVDPVFNDVRIKRSLPPGMKLDVGDFTQTGFIAEGNYNQARIKDISGTSDSYTALYYDRGNLRKVGAGTTLTAFQFYLEACLELDDVVAAVIDIDGGPNSMAILNDRFNDVDNIFFRRGDWNNDENWAKGTIPNETSKVLIESHATIPADYVAKADEILIDVGSIRIKDGGQLVHNNTGVSASVEKTFEPYPYGSQKGGYYLFTNPTATALDPQYIYGGMVEDYGGNNPYDLYYFDQSEQLEWRNYKQNHFELGNGKGYLYATSSGKEILFGNEAVNPANADINVPVTYDATASFKGFNLVGNPFVCNAYLADGRDFYVLNGDGDEVVISDVNSIAPMQGLFVQTTANESNVTFTTTVPTRGSALNISVMRNPEGRGDKASTLVDNARIRFDGNSSLEKFQFDPNHTKVYIPQGGKDYAVAVIASDSEAIQTEIPVNFKASENGTYTLSVNAEGVELDYLHLIDNLTGADVDLIALLRGQGGGNESLSSSYTFTAKTTDYASRFRLVFSVCGDTNDNNETFAFISNGNIIVDGDGTLQVVDVMGRAVVSVGGRTRCVPTSGMTPGIYVLRLINGDDVKTQKIIIE